ncbi:hypothetical protein GLP05_24275, partial [Escherichia coli]|nr:hypothetical protein [Escherichia coli]
LYLDGTVSPMYMKGRTLQLQRYPFVNMISVERKGYNDSFVSDTEDGADAGCDVNALSGLHDDAIY